MPSWRESASAECQSDLDRLLEAALPFAQQMLAKHGAFHPYGAAVKSNGEVGLVAAGLGSEQPVTADVVALLYDGLQSQAKEIEIRAGAVVADVRIRDTGEDAIQVALEHREGVTLVLVLPYKKKRFGGVSYGDMKALAGERRIWK